MSCQIKFIHLYDETVLDISDREEEFLTDLQRLCGCLVSNEYRCDFDKDDFVYFFLDPKNNLVKIGRSVNPRQRLKNHKRELPGSKIIFQIRIPKRIAAVVDAERAFHCKFEDLRATHPMYPGSLEWFSYKGKLKYFLNREVAA